MKALAWALLTVLFIVTAVHARDLSVDSAKNTRAAMATAQAGEVLHPVWSQNSAAPQVPWWQAVCRSPKRSCPACCRGG